MENTLEQDLGPFLQNSFGDRFLFSVNRSSFQCMAADQVYTDYYGRDFFRAGHFYLIVGTDSGLLVRYLLNQNLPETTRVVFLELPEVLERLGEVLDLEALPENLAVATWDQIGWQLKNFDLLQYIFANQSTILKALCTNDAFIPEYYELYLSLKKELDEAIFATRTNLGDRTFMVRQLDNITETRCPSQCLRDRFAGKTAMVLAVGPSLEEIIPWVKKNRDSMVVIAVSRAARKLYEVGLVPHIILTMDPSDLSFDVSRETMHFFRDTLFIYGKHSTPLMLSQWRGQHLYVGDRFPWSTPLNKATLGIAGPTVTQSAVRIALDMGFSRILLGGVDLCFSRDGFAYSSSVSGREKGAVVGDVPGGVETNGGWHAGSITPYLVGARIMKTLAMQAKNSGSEIINLAAGAIKIEGIDFIPTSQLKIEPAVESLEAFIRSHLSDDDREARMAHYRKVEEELIRARKAIFSIQRLAKSALAANQKIFDPTSGKSPTVYQQRMERIEKKIATQYGPFPRLLKIFGILRFLRIIEPGQQDWSDERKEKTGRVYYEAYRDTAKELLFLIDRSLNRISVRIQEESPEADFLALAEQWEKDRTFGRCLVWRDRNPAAWDQLSPEAKVKFEELELRYRKILDHQEDLSKVKAAPKVELREMRAKAQVTFRKRHLDGLQILITGLQSNAEHAAEKTLLQLIHGYAHELSGATQAAFDQYRAVIDAGHPVLTEDALVRVADLASQQNDLETLKMAFQCLADLSPIYASRYADLLWLLGEHMEALDVYAGYLENVPGDLRALLRLSQYYLELNAPEAARTALEYIFQADPDNVTAKALWDKLPAAVAQRPAAGM